MLEPKPFISGETFVNYSIPIFDGAEMDNLRKVAESGHITAGPWTERFEARMMQFFGSRGFILVNSGSSANLLMLSALCSQNLDNHLVPGDKVLIPALGFPTTLAPIIQCGLVPVFIDVELSMYSPHTDAIEKAVQKHKPKLVFLPHPLGLPFAADVVRNICDNYGIWFLEDGCDALGATDISQLVGTFGAMSSLSFYPAHHMTMGEGGGVVINDPKVKVIARSLSEWGRACYCAPGKSNTCGIRFDWDYPSLPPKHDHKYTYSEIGFNFQPTDMQAAIGCAQLDKLEFIIRRRRENFSCLNGLLRSNGLENYFILPEPYPLTNPSPYAYPLICREGVDRRKVVAALEAAKIETRPIFGGNLIRQPGFMNIKYEIFDRLSNTDVIMENGFFVGVHPLLSLGVMDYIAGQLMRAVANG